ncbi:MAG: hypothetical protein WAW39_22215 [Prosthecobacter sp.]|uniref:hypothetical protein n=1 Tax=Prosthecobacter sp. TaxID=1965333 RepID=UPI003BB0C442
MNQPNSSHFHAGKAARQAGRPCQVWDGRMSAKSKAEWYEGWNFQDAYQRGQPDPELVTQNDNFFADLRAELRGARA